MLALAVNSLGGATPGTLLHRLSLFIAIAAFAVTSAYSTILAFDALLFRVIARYEDEWKGGAAVDDILVRMHLKTPPATTRPLAERAAGTRRLAMRQRRAFAVSAAGALLLAIPA
jgi:hypothetical protein